MIWFNLRTFYFQDSATEDLVSESIENIYGTIIGLWDFLQHVQQTSQNRVYNQLRRAIAGQSILIYSRNRNLLTGIYMPFLVSS